ncbi:MAG TPA: tetratricopeptide repeat protein [Gemmataceae bacterium]|nr:tetratricopeptide repeat protein [Gemmataceae bacterium]
MSNSPVSTTPKLTPDQRRAAAGQFERARQVLKGGDYDYCLQLLLACCKIDPANLIYRQELRQTQRAKYGNNQKGQPLAIVRSLWGRLRLKQIMLKGNYLEALVLAEQILMRNPWDLGTHLVMAQAFEELEMHDHALWTLEQIRPTNAQNPSVNRPLARLYERRGNFNQAIALWELVRKADPSDVEAQRKGKDLAASATIAKGKYEDVLKGDALSPQAEKETATDQPVLPADVTTEDRHPREVANLLEKIKANPKNANAHLHLSNLYRKAEQFDKAKETLQKAMPLTGNSFDIAQELFDLDIEPFRRDLAVTEERLRQKPGDKELQQIRAGLIKEINTRELEFHRRRSDRYPTDMAARFEMGLRLQRGGQLDEAIKELQAVRSDPRHHGKALFYLGLCFLARNNWRLAQRNFEEALKQLGAGDAVLQKEAMFHLAEGYARTGELERALELGSDLANLDYSYRNIGALLEEWQTRTVK